MIMANFIDENFWLIFALMTIIIFGYLYYDAFLQDKRKPKYKLDKDGYVMFYYRRYSCWEYFPLWNDNNDKRIIHILDRIRNIDYDISYIGPGRAKWRLKFDDYAPITQDFITDYVRKTYSEIENSEQLWQLHTLYIDKENTILNNIAKDNIFKAYESNI